MTRLRAVGLLKRPDRLAFPAGLVKQDATVVPRFGVTGILLDDLVIQPLRVQHPARLVIVAGQRHQAACCLICHDPSRICGITYRGRFESTRLLSRLQRRGPLADNVDDRTGQHGKVFRIDDQWRHHVDDVAERTNPDALLDESAAERI